MLSVNGSLAVVLRAFNSFARFRTIRMQAPVEPAVVRSVS
jgi:hypothetical protein